MSARERSFWGWGWADKFPDEAGRRNLAQMAAALLGGVELELKTPPRLEEIELPRPRLAPPDELAEFCGAGPRERALHTHGRGFRDVLRGFGGDFTAAPDFVATPRSEEEVEAVLAWCDRESVACIPFGGGTSVVGGVEAEVGEGHRGAVSLDLGGLAEVLEVDPRSRAARIQAGATGPALEAALAEHGFSLRHYPQSFEFSTLGGWVATRAGGHFATLYTHIDDLVESVQMITPRGVWASRRLPGSGAGPSPDRMVLGSEGILGVITEAWVRVQERPQWKVGASVRFRDFWAAVEAVREIAQSGLYPANCRLLDSREAMLNRVSADGSSVLLLGFESSDHPLEPWMNRALEIARARGGDCGEPTSRARDSESSTWRAAFLEAPYLMNALVSLGCVVDTFETACTWDRFEELHGAVVRAVKDAMSRECGKGLLTCRFTHVYPDGPAPYYTFVAPGRDGAEEAQWRAIKEAASEALIAHGATITHHHAVGRLHRPFYRRQRPEPFAEALRAAKNTLDPAGILNPGVLL